ncbi:hypothetical protein KAW80_02550 [Candidatus Babeliales bacterium]|nr:hypothetical protein [Candidatus Babeliales bacterium]
MSTENINYDLVKLLKSKMDNVWRLEKFYCKDAEDANCKSLESLKQILENESLHVKMLKEAIKERMDAGIF